MGDILLIAGFGGDAIDVPVDVMRDVVAANVLCVPGGGPQRSLAASCRAVAA
ncbi:MAG: hypothetical protein K2X57_19160 [Xanthobacteraceae bacterium]|nr:hypothetical protein [Xanthobacteraceae bacterium]